MEKEEEVMKKADQEEKQKQLNEELAFISKLEDHQLTHKMERLRKQIQSPLALKLPDKGEKCRRSLKVCEDELEKRNQLRPRKIILEDPQKAENENSNQSNQKAENGNSNQSPQKDVNEYSNLSPRSAECGNSKKLSQKAECENSKQSQNSCSPVACNDCSSETPPSQACSQSKVNPLLQKPVEKGNLSAQTSVNPFLEELPVLHHGNYPNRRSRGHFFNSRWGYRNSMRRPPLTSQRSHIHGENEWRSPCVAEDTDESPTFNHQRKYENEHGSPLGADADEFPGFNRQSQIDNERRPPPGAQDPDYPRFNRPHPYAYYPRHSFKRHRQTETGIPTLQRIVRNLLEGPTPPRPHYQPRFRVPPESQMAELIFTMEQQLETVHTQLAGLESQVATRMNRMEAKLEQIIQVQTGNKSSRNATSEQQGEESAS